MLYIESGISPENALQEIFLSYKVYPNLHHIDIVITNSEPQQTLLITEMNPVKTNNGRRICIRYILIHCLFHSLPSCYFFYYLIKYITNFLHALHCVEAKYEQH